MKVSVIVPIYNGQAFVEACCEQLAKQTLKGLEFILVDDGSVDDTGILCDRMARQYENCKVIHQPNRGVSAARNQGLSLAAGKYIGFMDVDDEIEEDMYEALYHTAITQKLDVICMNRIGKPGEVTVYDKKEDWINDLLMEKIGMSVWSKLFRRQLLHENSFTEGLRVHEDLLMVYNTLSSAERVGVVNINKYHYIQRENSSSRVAVFSEKYFDAIKIAKRIYTDIAGRFPTLAEVNEARKARTYLRITKIYYLRKAPEEYRQVIQNLRDYLITVDKRLIARYFTRFDVLRLFLYLYMKPLFCLLIRTVDKK